MEQLPETEKSENDLNNKTFKGERVKCECGIEVSKKQLNRHRKSNKHINLMENLPNSE
jgi:hypothetical protein